MMTLRSGGGREGLRTGGGAVVDAVVVLLVTGVVAFAAPGKGGSFTVSGGGAVTEVTGIISDESGGADRTRIDAGEGRAFVEIGLSNTSSSVTESLTEMPERRVPTESCTNAR